MEKIIKFTIIIILSNLIQLNAKLERLTKGLPSKGIAAFTMAVDKKLPNNVFVGATGYLYHSSDNGENWAKVDSFKKVSGITITKILACYPMIIVVSSTYGRLSISNDYGKSWHDIDTLYRIGESGGKIYAREFYDLYYYNDSIYIATDCAPFMSTDNGIHWTPLMKGRNNGYNNTSSVVLLKNILYIIANHKIFLSTDMGGTWLEDKNLKFKPGTYAPWYLYKFNDMIIAWCTDTDSIKIYSLENPGDNWNLVITLSDSVIQKLIICDNIIYAAGAKFGIFFSKDTGKTWTAYNDGFDRYDEKFGYSGDMGDVGKDYLFAMTGWDDGTRLFRAPLKNCEIVEATDVPDVGEDSKPAPTIYPNPASEWLTIQWREQGVATPCSTGEVHGVTTPCSTMMIAVYDVFGERVLGEIPLNPPFPKGEMEVDVSGLPAGVYYVVVNAGGGRIVKQFAVVR